MKSLALPSLLLLATAAFAQVDTARTVATVNGEEIKGAEYYRRMEYLGGVGKQFGNVYTEMAPGLLTLNALITERLTLQLAREKGIYPSDPEVTKEIEYRSTKDPNYLGRWKASGKNDEELRNEVRLGLAFYKLQTYGITIADGEIDAFYAAQPRRFTIPKRMKLRVIVVATEEQKTTVDQELSSGKPFAEVAKVRSLDSNAKGGGEYRTVAVDDFGPGLKTAVGDLKKGQVSVWIASKAGGQDTWLKFYVDDILPESKVQLDANVRREVRQDLALQRGRIKNDVRKELGEMRRKAKIDITAPEFAEGYKEFIDLFIGGPGTPSNTPAPGPNTGG